MPEPWTQNLKHTFLIHLVWNTHFVAQNYLNQSKAYAIKEQRTFSNSPDHLHCNPFLSKPQTLALHQLSAVLSEQESHDVLHSDVPPCGVDVWLILSPAKKKKTLRHRLDLQNDLGVWGLSWGNKKKYKGCVRVENVFWWLGAKQHQHIKVL